MDGSTAGPGVFPTGYLPPLGRSPPPGRFSTVVATENEPSRETVSDVRLVPQHHTIIATDVAKSGGRSDALLIRMRRDLREILSNALEAQGLEPARLTHIDDGDGFRYLIPADVAPPHAALDPFIGRLGIELRMHREAANEANRLRLRIAVHSGLLYPEAEGTYTGVPLKDCARLLNADAGRELLDEHPGADLVLLLTDSFYSDVVGSGTTLDPKAFRPIRIRVKETDRTGWAYLPNVVPDPAGSPAPGAARPAAPSSPVPEAEARSGVWIAGDRHTFHGPIVGGDYRG
jgi:hypothetical protein